MDSLIDGHLNRIHDREVAEQRRSKLYFAGLVFAIAVVVVALAVVLR